ncbi:hypothetical protein RXV95_15565 [Novosphingobium sp. ZN18A2]|uniref:hypothetical protein n=1 Tax=Novosphingobium sp. ZN18A2 TaxID=3079861 RepID=UPI0030D23276
MASNPEARGTVPPEAGRPDFGHSAATALSAKWSALQDAGDIVCRLAGLSPDARQPAVCDFPDMMKDAGDWRREIARRGVDDLVAIMEPGLSALMAVRARGADPAPAALALWHEFIAARTALLALAPPPGAGRDA